MIKWMRLFWRRPLRSLIILGITCCCLCVVGIHILHSPAQSGSGASDVHEPTKVRRHKIGRHKKLLHSQLDWLEDDHKVVQKIPDIFNDVDQLHALRHAPLVPDGEQERRVRPKLKGRDPELVINLADGIEKSHRSNGRSVRKANEEPVIKGNEINRDYRVNKMPDSFVQKPRTSESVNSSALGWHKHKQLPSDDSHKSVLHDPVLDSNLKFPSGIGHNLSSSYPTEVIFNRKGEKFDQDAPAVHYQSSTNTVADRTTALHTAGAVASVRSARRRHVFRRSRHDPAPEWSDQLYFNRSDPPPEFLQWHKDSESLCGDKFTVYSHEFASLRGVTIDREFCTCGLRGGEFIENVLRQTEEAEYYKFEMGCFRVVCDDFARPVYTFNGNNHLNSWMYSLSLKGNEQRLAKQIRSQFTIAVTRYEYANLYHTMTDWYSAFLLMQFYNHTAYSTNILIIDSHPFGQLDSTWSQLFNSTVRLSALPQTTQFTDLVWGVMGYNSLMTTMVSSPTPPLYEQFRDFFLSGFAINPSEHRLDCEHISVLFIWRHDYVAHPRNPSGVVVRKIHNEAQLLRYIEKRNPGYRVKGSQIDLYSMREQLDMVTQADVMIGMHGAGLTHAVFLPRRAGLIELVPSYWSASGEHFMAIAKWRGLVYEQWVNNDPLREIDDKSTIVPPNVLNGLIKKVVTQLCGSSGGTTKHVHLRQEVVYDAADNEKVAHNVNPEAGHEMDSEALLPSRNVTQRVSDNGGMHLDKSIA